MAKSRTLIVVEKDPYNIVDRRILTPQEHLLIGSTLFGEYLLYPRRPTALVDKSLTLEEVNRLRREQIRIVSHSAWDFFNEGLTKKAERYAMVFKLGVVNQQTGDVEGKYPKFAGVFDSHANTIDQAELARYQMTDEGERRLSFEYQRSSPERASI